MKILVSNVPAYIYDHERHFIGAGDQRWSHSYRIPKGSRENHHIAYPFNIGYSSALLKRDTDFEIRSYDPCAIDQDEKEFSDFISSYDPDLLLVELPTVCFPLMMKVLKDLKESIDCCLAISGAHITALTKQVMRQYPFIDFALIGEYELTLKELAEMIDRDGEDERLKGIKGLAFRTKDRIFVNERRDLLMDLDYLPFPDREDMPPHYYRDAVVAGEPCVQMLSSKGCPVGCSFCVPINVIFASKMYRTRSATRIVDEMVLCKEKYGAKQIYFDDDTMVINRKHIHSICDELISRRIDIPWTCMGDITVDFDTLDKMQKAECVGIKFGVESISQEGLKRIHKGTVTKDRVRNFVKMCKKLGLWTHASYVIGIPTDTRKSILEMAGFAVELETDSCQFSIATPFPGAPFFEEAKENGWLSTLDWTKYDGANYSVLSYPWLSSEEIEELLILIVKKYLRHRILVHLKDPPKLLKALTHDPRKLLIGIKLGLTQGWPYKLDDAPSKK